MEQDVTLRKKSKKCKKAKESPCTKTSNSNGKTKSHSSENVNRVNYNKKKSEILFDLGPPLRVKSDWERSSEHSNATRTKKTINIVPIYKSFRSGDKQNPREAKSENLPIIKLPKNRKTVKNGQFGGKTSKLNPSHPDLQTKDFEKEESIKESQRSGAELGEKSLSTFTKQQKSRDRINSFEPSKGVESSASTSGKRIAAADDSRNLQKKTENCKKLAKRVRFKEEIKGISGGISGGMNEGMKKRSESNDGGGIQMTAKLAQVQPKAFLDDLRGGKPQGDLEKSEKENYRGGGEEDRKRGRGQESKGAGREGLAKAKMGKKELKEASREGRREGAKKEGVERGAKKPAAKKLRRPAKPGGGRDSLESLKWARGSNISWKKTKSGELVCILTVAGENFFVKKRIGRGGYSEVYKVVGIRSRRKFALKHITVRDPEVTANFEREIQLLTALKDEKSIVRLYAHENDVENQQIFMVLELAQGDMSGFIRANTPMDVLSARYFWGQMVQAVHVLHESRIVHKDLKPQNFVLVNSQVKLIDFGLANTVSDFTTHIYNEKTEGTPSYMAPESFKACDGLIAVSRGTDIWSLGIILFEMMVGKTPFQYLKGFAKCAAIVNGNKIPLEKISDSLVLEEIGE